jgi:uncharacterized protein YbjQ (UPF0145 family)
VPASSTSTSTASVATRARSRYGGDCRSPGVRTAGPAQDRLVEAAQQRGADAVLAMRFDANDLWNIGQEICAYVTAVKIRNL